MNKNLKVALKNFSGEQGFAIPIALGMGLIMILVATTMIVRSQGDQVTASAQKETARGLSAAETGITQYQSLINNNRGIATYPRTGTNSWTNAANITNLSTSCAGSSAAAVTAAATTVWRDVDSSDPTQGQYRLVDYTYGPTEGTAPGTGTLTVEGRVNQSGTGSTASNDVGTATTRLQVNIPVQQSDPSSVPFPGMWVNASVSTTNVSANIMAPCTGTATATFAPGYGLNRTNLTMPSTPSKPTTNITTIINPSGLTLPEDPTNLSNYNSTTGEYQYSVSQIDDTFTIRPGYKVAIYLDGNIDLQGGQKAIVHQCGSTPNCSSTDARIYGLSSNGTLHLDGNPSICDIFFLGPTYDVDVNGGGGAQGCGGGATTNGAIWARSWSGGGTGTGSHVAIAQTATTWAAVSSFLPIQLPPRIETVSSWQRQEAAAP